MTVCWRTISDDGKLGLWEVAAGGEYRTLVRAAAAGKGFYHHPSIRSDGRLLAVGMGDGFGLWDLPSGNELAFLESPGTDFVLFEPSGALLTNGSAGLLRWPVQADAASPGLLRIGPPHKLSVPGPICHVACSGDGRVIAVSQFQGGRVLHADRPDQPVPIGPHDDARYVAVSPDGRWVVTGAHNGTGVKIWEARSGELEKELPVDSGSRVGFSPDGKWLATTGGGLRLWAVGSWREGPQIGVGAAFAFSADGKLLAVETGHGAVRLVDPDTGREYARLENPNQDRADFLSFSPDGTQLVTTEGRQPVVPRLGPACHPEAIGQDGPGLGPAALPAGAGGQRNAAAPDPGRARRPGSVAAGREESNAAVDRAETSRTGGESEQRQGVQRSRVDLPDRPRSAPRLESRAARGPKGRATGPGPDESQHAGTGVLSRRPLSGGGGNLGAQSQGPGRLGLGLRPLLPGDEPPPARRERTARQFYDLAVRWSAAHHEALNRYVVELAAIQAEAAELLGVKDKKH